MFKIISAKPVCVMCSIIAVQEICGTLVFSQGYIRDVPDFSFSNPARATFGGKYCT